MNTKMKADLKSIANALDSIYNLENYFDLHTGKIVEIIIDEYEDFDDDFVQEDVSDRARYVKIESEKYNLEYTIMKNFCLSLPESRDKEILLRGISGKGAFRMFNELIDSMDLREKWYIFKKEALVEEAKLWCRHNSIEYE